MLQSWATYLLGSTTNNPENQGATAVGVSELSETNTRLTTIDDDWVIVDRDSEGNSDDASSVDSFEVFSTQDGDEVRLKVPSSGSHLHRSSSSSSLPRTSSLEDSWFLTPPPCFTSTGPIHMETSPLENLLIEHPSMSVYQVSTHHNVNPRLRLCDTSSMNESVAESDFADDMEEIVEEDPIALVERRGRRLVVRMIQMEERQYSLNKQAQKLQIQKTSKPLKRSFLERNNKAREINSRNRRQRRGERSQGAKRSHANNNRKC